MATKKSSRSASVPFLAVSLCLAACTTTQIRVDRGEHETTRLEAGEAVVVLSGDGKIGDEEADGCLGEKMRSLAPGLRFVPAVQFRESLYPYFMPSTTPREPEQFKATVNNPLVQQRIATLGVRYLILFRRNYETENDWHNYIFCGAGAGSGTGGGGGCLGFAWWNRKSGIGAEIFDLTGKSLEGKLAAEAKGTGVMPAFGLPIPLYVPATDSAVCRETARHLLQAIGIGAW